MELTIAGGGVIDLASRQDVEDHHRRLADLLAKPNAHGQSLAGAEEPAGGQATLIDLGSPPFGMVWLPQQLSVFGADPFLITGNAFIANVSAAAFKGSLPLEAALKIGPPVTGLNLSDVIQGGFQIPQTIGLPDKVAIFGQEHLYVVLGGSGLVAGAAIYWATAFVVEMRADDLALT